MLPSTAVVIEAILKTDPTLMLQDRYRIISAAKNHGVYPQQDEDTPTKQDTRILSRAEVARRFDRSLRFVDKLAAEGILRRVILPGRKRSCGYLSKDVEHLLTGGIAP